MHKQTVYNHCQPFTAINNHCISCQPLCNNFSTNVQLCIHDRASCPAVRHPSYSYNYICYTTLYTIGLASLLLMAALLLVLRRRRLARKMTEAKPDKTSEPVNEYKVRKYLFCTYPLNVPKTIVAETAPFFSWFWLRLSTQIDRVFILKSLI